VFLGYETRNVIVQRDYIGKAVRDRDVITVSGHAKKTAKPDLAQIDIGLYSEGATVAAVQSDNSAKMNAVIAAIKALGVKDADIQSSNYNLQPKFDYTNSKQTLTGYTLTQSVGVKLRDLTKVGDVIDKSVAAGANQVNSLQFTIDDPTALQDSTRIDAIKDARTKANALADALGLHIVKVVTFSESGGVTPPMPYASDMVAMKSAAGAVPTIQAGSLDVDMTVAVTFEVR